MLDRLLSSYFADFYDFIFSESLGLGKAGGRVKATDKDIGENAKSIYAIVAGNEKGVFEITTDSQTQEGVIVLKKVRYMLHILAVNRHQACLEQSIWIIKNTL